MGKSRNLNWKGKVCQLWRMSEWNGAHFSFCFSRHRYRVPPPPSVCLSRDKKVILIERGGSGAFTRWLAGRSNLHSRLCWSLEFQAWGSLELALGFVPISYLGRVKFLSRDGYFEKLPLDVRREEWNCVKRWSLVCVHDLLLSCIFSVLPIANLNLPIQSYMKILLDRTLFGSEKVWKVLQGSANLHELLAS